MADMRAYSNCTYFLRGTCKNESCPFKHDEDAKRHFQAASAAATTHKAPAPAVPDGHCFFFLKGPDGCNKGDACKFIHDEGLKVTMTEERLRGPLPEAAPRAQAQPPQAALLPRHRQSTGDSASLVVHLEDASPQPGRPHPAQSQGQYRPQQQQQRPFQQSPAAFGRQPLGNGFKEEQQQQQHIGPGPAWNAQQNGRPQQQQSRDGAGRIQSLWPGARAFEPEQRQHSRHPPASITAVVPSPEPLKGRRSILDRLGPRLSDTPEPVDASPPPEDTFRRRPALASRIALPQEPQEQARQAAMKRSAPSIGSVRTDVEDGDRPAPRAQQQAPRAVTSPRTAAKRARLDQPLEPLRRTPAQTAASRLAAHGGDRAVRPAAAAPQPRQRVAPSQPAAPQGDRLDRSAAGTSSGSQPPGIFKPPKSREELRKEREAAAGSAQPSVPTPQAAPAAQQASRHPAVSAQAAAAAAHPSAAPAAAGARAVPKARVMPQSAHPAAAATMPKATSAAASAAEPVAVHAKATIKPASTPKSASAEFDFNVDSIDDVEEEIFDHLAEEEGYPVTGKGAATASDFDKELAEFENAFD